MLFQAVKAKHVEIAVSDYLNYSNRNLICYAQTICLELHFILTGNVLFSLDGLGWRELDAGHHNIIALSGVRNETIFQVTPVSTCDFHFTVAYIKRLSVKYPQLQRLLDALGKGGYTSLHISPAETNIFMFHLIVKIKEAIKAGKAEDENTVAMIERLLIMVLEDEPVKTKYKYTYTDVKNMYDAGRYIQENLDREKSLFALVKDCLMESDHFREGFTLLHGCLPKTYLQEQKLAKAKMLFDERKLTRLSSIAEICNYKSVLGLKLAFKKKYDVDLDDFLR